MDDVSALLEPFKAADVGASGSIAAEKYDFFPVDGKAVSEVVIVPDLENRLV